MNEAIRVLHFSDIHIGMENYGGTDPNTGLSTRVVDFVRRLDSMIEIARERDVDLAIFAGDAFKSRNPSPTFQREFAFRIQDLAELCPVMLLVGNHDLPTIEKRASSIEIYETLRVPNTYLGRDYGLQVIDTKRGPVVVATAPYPVRNHLLQDINLPHRATIAEIDALMELELDRKLQQLAQDASQYDMPRILTGHFSVSEAMLGSERSIMLGRDITVMLSTIADPAWDYVALGHIHKHQCLTGKRQPPVVYSGSLERIDFGEENDPKGFVCADVSRGRTQWEFIELDCRPFVTLRIDVKGKGNPTQHVLDEIARHDLRDAVVRVLITADPESDLLLQDRLIHQALERATIYHLATIQRAVDRPARMRLGSSPEGLSAEELLHRYLLTKEIPLDRIGVLMEYAQQIFTSED